MATVGWLPPETRLRCDAGGGYDDDKSEEQEGGGKGHSGAGASCRRGLSQVNLNAGGIDVGASSHFVAVSADRAEPPVQEFAAFTADLYRLADWLGECDVATVVMESTGVYWIPLVRGVGRAGV